MSQTFFRQMGMQREADMIEQQIKMRGSAGGQPGGKWYVTALTELVPRFFCFYFKQILYKYVAALLLSQPSSKRITLSFFFVKTKKIRNNFLFSFFSFLYFDIPTYLPYKKLNKL